MHQGNWTCSGCGGDIKELPFEPRRTDGLLCRDCHQKKRTTSDGESRGGGMQSDRPSFEGDWKCSGCSTAITSLPFEPRSTENLLCRDCYRSKKNS